MAPRCWSNIVDVIPLPIDDQRGLVDADASARTHARAGRRVYSGGDGWATRSSNQIAASMALGSVATRCATGSNRGDSESW